MIVIFTLYFNFFFSIFYDTYICFLCLHGRARKEESDLIYIYIR